MLAHSSHILQPLDVGCFSPLKTAYGRQVEGLMRLGVNHISKEEFLTAYLEVHKASFTTSNIQAGFAATRLVPYEPERVLSNLNPVIRTPSPVPSAESVWESKTPRNLMEVARQATHIRSIRGQRRRLQIRPLPSFLRASKQPCTKGQFYSLRTLHFGQKTNVRSKRGLNVVKQLQLEVL